MNQDTYGHVAPIGKAIGNGNRLELLELMARDAARLMRTHGIDDWAMDEGVLEWRAGGSVDLTATA